jgi:GT2 family glycosyltransferase
VPAPIRLGVVLYRTAPAEVTRLGRSLRLARTVEGAPAFDVAFLDNSPDERLRAAVEAHGAYAHAGANLGFGAAHNRLMREAFAAGAGAYVCVNPDAVLHPDCVRELTAEAARHPRPGLVEARQFPDEHPKPYDPATHATPWCSGCVLLVTRALFEAVGGFDERFFMYCEDVDLSWRARAAGFQTALAPRALVHHVATGRARSRAIEALMLRSGVLLGRKYGDLEFAREATAELGRLGERPPAHAGGPSASPSERAAADLLHDFHFAAVRW